jgi:hypothetical protein
MVKTKALVKNNERQLPHCEQDAHGGGLACQTNGQEKKQSNVCCIGNKQSGRTYGIESILAAFV